MAVRIKPQTTTKARFPGNLIFGRALDKVDEPAVGVVLLAQHPRMTCSSGSSLCKISLTSTSSDKIGMGLHPHGVCLDNPRHAWYFSDDVGDGEAGRDCDNRHHTEFE
jgi:hypothetical protein